ncbi:MAG: conserved oligomeric Golgi complex subunit 6 [Candidatus Nomurabacteria bacterium]|nr:conserved oligomeric Golgi complex subunit 6 [Candidatus Nomurabacteria bacterium]
MNTVSTFSIASIITLLFLAGGAHTFAQNADQAAQIGTPIAGFIERLRADQAERRENLMEKTTSQPENQAPISTFVLPEPAHVRRSTRTEIPSQHIIISQFDKATDRLYTVSDRLSDQIQSLNDRAIDTGVAETTLEQSVTFLDQAEDLISQAEELLGNGTTFGFSVIKTRPLLKEAQEYIISSRMLLIETVKTLKISLTDVL